MAIILEEEQLKKLTRKRKPKRFRKTKPMVKQERAMRQRTEKLWEEVLLSSSQRIAQLVKEGAPIERLSEIIESSLLTAQQQYGVATDDIVSSWGLSLNDDSRWAFRSALMKSVGVDISAFLDTPEVSDTLALGLWSTTNLIKTIPSDYFGEISQAIADNFYGQDQPQGRTLLEQIEFLGGVSKKRAMVIARDQTKKMQSNLDQTRQMAIGGEEYIWRTTRSNRVAGKPGGLYPPTPAMKFSTTHGNHWEREGKKFRWDTPPPDGHPGQGILCMCWAEPVIDLKKLVENAQVG